MCPNCLKKLRNVTVAAILFQLFVVSIVVSVSYGFDTGFGDYSIDEVADAIYHAENSKKYPYGIKSINTNGDPVYARRICKNTISNNIQRYKNYGHKKHKAYLEFLASRYCPIGAPDDPTGLNQHWLKNVRWFLKHPKKVNHG